MNEKLRTEIYSLLHELCGYFEDHADADFNGESFVPNEAMKFLSEIKDIQSKLYFE